MLDRDQTVSLPAGWDGFRREQHAVCAAAVLLVLLRSVVPVLYEGYFFDSDQAIVGLMAKHLSEFRDFPLFFYGQNYMLGVQAWIIAPVFWIVRPSVAGMRVPFVVLNAILAVWLIRALGRRLELRPLVAFVAVLPFAIPTPAMAAHLVEMQGSCVEPFIYVLLLWSLRDRPLGFGALLAIGFLHREFTIFAVPALLVVEAATGERWSGANIKRATLGLAAFAGVWAGVNGANAYFTRGQLGLQAASLGGQLCLDLHDIIARSRSMLTEALPALVGGARNNLEDLSMNISFAAGSAMIGWVVAAAMALMLARLIALWSRAGRLEEPDGFAVYLGVVGLCAIGVYPLSCAVGPGLPLLRYLLLALLVPVAAFGLFMRRESSHALKTTMTCAFLVWAAANALDHARLIQAAARTPPANERRVLADYLVSHHIKYARAIYWDAYAVDFLSREQVTVASSDIFRIPAYQQTVDQHAAEAVNLPRLPCSGGAIVASWCVQRP